MLKTSICYIIYGDGESFLLRMDYTVYLVIAVFRSIVFIKINYVMGIRIK